MLQIFKVQQLTLRESRLHFISSISDIRKYNHTNDELSWRQEGGLVIREMNGLNFPVTGGVN